jgi:hypothetical protein
MTLGDGVRRNVAKITEEERLLLVNAIRTLDTSGFVYPNNTGHEGADAAGNITKWDMQEQIHKDGHAHGLDVHGGPAFIPWHRALVNRFEALLREVDPRLSLHYWDWTTDPRVAAPGGVTLFTPSFMGSAAGNAGPPLADFESTEITGDAAEGIPGDGIHDHIWRQVGAVAANPDGSPAIMSDAAILARTTFTAFAKQLTDAHNNVAHSYIGGTLTAPHFSFHDPFVFLLHSNLDRLWATWQRDPDHPERLVPATAYGTILADKGLPADYFAELVQPWAGVDNAGIPRTDLNPWRSDPTQRTPINYLDPSLITPPAYDTAPHSSMLVTDRDTFSAAEVLTTSSFPRAFYVLYDGFAPDELGTPVTAPSIAFHFDTAGGAVVPGMGATLREIDYEDPGRAPSRPQRMTFVFDLHIGDPAVFVGFPETRTVTVRATKGTNRADAALRLINQPNPYMVDGAVSWLSTDLRVFQMRPNMVRAGVTHPDPAANPTATSSFLTTLLGVFNDPSLPNDEFHPFHDISTDPQASNLELSRTVNGTRVFNYAVAKVRYRANAITAGHVKVFFRAFSTMVSALDYSTTTNYRRANTGDAAIPLLGMIGSEIASIPFFAAPRIDSSAHDMSEQSDLTNMRDISPVVGQESVAYFGCWLDFNQTEPQFPAHPSGDGYFAGRQSIMGLMRGHHQCLVAEIYFQPGGFDPIPFGASPGSSDRLAQRNLAIVESDNPGGGATHTVQHTLRVKPSTWPPDRGPGTITAAMSVRREAGARTEATHKNRIGPDELMIAWNNVPRDALASVYFPEWDAQEVLLLSAMHPRPDVLARQDAHTITCRVADVTYIPIPSGTVKDFAGMLTVELPPGVADGQVFTIDVRQLSGVTRKILGGFQITIPVRLGEGLLRTEVRKLAVLRHVGQGLAPTDRWRPVFQRYLAQIEAKISGLGYDPATVPASPDDPGLVSDHPTPAEHCVTGTIRELTYDGRGRFDGFILDCGHRDQVFDACERSVEGLAVRACQEGATLRVCVHPDSGQISTISVICC